MLCKTLTIEITKSYLVITDEKQYHTCPADKHTMKCLVSKGHCCSLSEGLFPMQSHTYCNLGPCINNDNTIKSHCSITVKPISKNSITQLIPNHCLMSIVKPSAIEHRCLGYPDSETINPPLALSTIPERTSILHPT